tara:strand:- start:267 stop:464 length:198 start_codon:yes stop_codon:yes gene_type:complete
MKGKAKKRTQLIRDKAKNNSFNQSRNEKRNYQPIIFYPSKIAWSSLEMVLSDKNKKCLENLALAE